MTRTIRIGSAALAAVASLIVMADRSPAADGPARSGTITGWGATWVAMYNGDAKDCQWTGSGKGGNPECIAWLESGCNPSLAGRNPAVTASIENIGELADGTTQRDFSWRATSYPGWGTGGGVVLQFWREDCTEIRSSKWHSLDRSRWPRLTSRPDTTFVIPRDAEWMTVTTNDTANLKWTLA